MREKLMRIHRLIASAVFAATIAVSGASYAFETTSVGGTNPDGSAKFQDPDQQDLNKTLGGLQFKVTGGSNESQENSSDRPPWELKPTPPLSGFSTMGGSPMFQPGR
jgi:hypothetical protein